MKKFAGILISAAMLSSSVCYAEVSEPFDYSIKVSSINFIKAIKASKPQPNAITEPASQSVTEPIDLVTTELTTEFTTQPVVEPVTEFTTQSVVEPTTESTTYSITEQTTESSQSITEPATESTSDLTTTIPDIVVEPITENESTIAAVKDIFFNENIDLFDVPQGYMITENMQSHLDRLNKNLKTKILITIDDIKKPITAKDIAYFTDYNTGSIDYNKVWAYCARIMETYNTAPYSRKFKTHDGVLVNVPVGDYGWKVDMTGLTGTVYNNLINFKDVTLSYKSSKRAFAGGQTIHGNDIGGTYIEIDLTNQTVHWFKDGKCVLSDYCVTGKKSTPTPAGVWSLKSNTGRTRLKGPTWDVMVNYWAHFTQGCGLHDATWQSSFGLARWKAGYGSHGCVNLSSATAKKAKSIMQIGEPVIVYYR